MLLPQKLLEIPWSSWDTLFFLMLMQKQVYNSELLSQHSVANYEYALDVDVQLLR